jgi:hypothetical protein
MVSETEGLTDSFLLIHNPEVLTAIFELSCLTADPSLQQKVLEDFYCLLATELQNREMFLMQQHWQTWLLGMLAQNSASALPLDKEYSHYHSIPANIFSTIVKIFVLLFHHCVYVVSYLFISIYLFIYFDLFKILEKWLACYCTISSNFTTFC